MKVLKRGKRWGLIIRDVFLFVVLTMACLLIFSSLASPVVAVLGEVSQLIVSQMLAVASAFVSVCLMTRLRSFPSPGIGFSIRGKIADMWGGFGVATLLYMAGFTFSWAMGWVSICKVQWPWMNLFSTWILFFWVAVFEEMVVRGFILGKMLDGGVPKWLALVLSSVFFSLMHLFNPNFEFLPFLNIILAGILLGVSYIYTRNLWFPIFLHWFWNWIQGSILGYGVSGNVLGESVLKLEFSGPDWLSGCVFGFEGTLLCTVLMIVGIVWIARKYR